MNFNKAMLYDEHPLIVCPSLARAVGLNEAIFLQQLHFLLRLPSGGRDISGERWIWNTYGQWRETHFTFWSIPTIKAVILTLEKRGLLRSCQPDGAMSRKKYYRIDYTELANVPAADSPEGITSIRSMRVKATRWKDKADPILNRDNNRDSETETSRKEGMIADKSAVFVSFEIPTIAMLNEHWNANYPYKERMKADRKTAAESWFSLNNWRGWRTADGQRIRDWRKAFDAWMRDYKPRTHDSGTGWKELEAVADEIGADYAALQQYVRYMNRANWMMPNPATGKDEPIHDRRTHFTAFWNTISENRFAA